MRLRARANLYAFIDWATTAQHPAGNAASARAQVIQNLLKDTRRFAVTKVLGGGIGDKTLWMYKCVTDRRLFCPFSLVHLTTVVFHPHPLTFDW